MILVINKSRREAESLALAFRYMGILAHAETPEHAASEISTLYRAIIIASPERLPDEQEYISRLRSYLSAIPIIALADEKYQLKASYDLTLPRTIPAARMLNSIVEFCNKVQIDPPGEYMLAGIDASVALGFVTYFSTPLPLTKTESLMLRMLMRAYPYPLSPKAILKYVFSQSKRPEIASIRTYICSINKKFKPHLGRNLIFSFEGGYIVMTPIFARDHQIELVSATK